MNIGPSFVRRDVKYAVSLFGFLLLPANVVKGVAIPARGALLRLAKAFSCAFSGLSPLIHLPYLGLMPTFARMMLRVECRYIAQSLQINTKDTSSSSAPSAAGPSGPTIADTMPHVTVEESSKQDVTTIFRGAVAVEKSDPSASSFASPSFVSAMTTDFEMTLKKALCRPIQIATGTWPTADAPGTVEFTGSLPELLLALPVVSRKLDGFQGIRGSITVRLLVTANPFQQGLLKLIWYPMQAQDPTAAGRFADPSSWSYLPSIELNLGKETACEMRIPFAMPVSFCDLVTSTASSRPQMGVLSLLVYGQLKVGAGGSGVSWNMYAHWNEDDLELFNPTPNAYQSGSHKVAGVTGEKEAKAGSISSALATGAKVAAVGSAIPALSAVAGPTEWALRTASRVASALGFSRFPIDEKPRVTSQSALPYYSTVEGPDVSVPLSLTMQPTLKVEPKLVGKTEDEMSIDAFVTRFGYHTVVNLSAGSGAGANIFNFKCGPYQHTSGENVYLKPHQVLAWLFNYYRGNFRIRVKFVKTKMHTGRLMFAFFPGVLTAQNLTQAEYVHREIVDLASVEELTYEVPFTAQTPYLNCLSSDSTGCYGSFQILVVNTLQAPPTVANNIDLIIETAMGEGSEWFSPSIHNDYFPVVPGGTLRDQPQYRNSAQSGSAPTAVITTLGDAKVVGHQIDTSQLCVGEKLMSLRQLIKLVANLYDSAFSQVSMVGGGGQGIPVYFNPFVIGATTGTSAGTAVLCRDYLNYLAPYFRFSRGSMRIKGAVSLNPEAGAFSSTAGLICSAARKATSADVGMFGTLSTALTSIPPYCDVQPVADGGMIRVLLPPWQTSVMTPLDYVLTTSAPAAGLPYRTNQLFLAIGGAYGPFLAGGTSLIQLNRQPADDYELLDFIGPPLISFNT